MSTNRRAGSLKQWASPSPTPTSRRTAMTSHESRKLPHTEGDLRRKAMTPKSPNETQNAMLWDLHRRATELEDAREEPCEFEHPHPEHPCGKPVPTTDRELLEQHEAVFPDCPDCEGRGFFPATYRGRPFRATCWDCGGTGRR